VKHVPTPHPDVNDILKVLKARVREILGSQLIGMVLFGSLANGGFDNDSDIDVLVVTCTEITHDTFTALSEMHAQIATIDSPWAVQLEVSYIPQSALRRFNPLDMRHPHLDRGSEEKLHLMDHVQDWIIQRYIVRERGIVLAGPDPKTLIDSVSQVDLRQAVVDVWPLWANPILADPSKIDQRGYQSFFVLSVCRALYTFKYGEIISKRAAAEWAKSHLDQRWVPLIERAWEGRRNPNQEATPDDISGTLEMIRCALQHITPTLYSDVNRVLHLLLKESQNVLGEQFVGMYLYGSLSSGGFDPETSDIDFLIVTVDILDANTIAAMEAMHNRIWKSGLKWSAKLEGSYLPQGHLPRFEKSGLAYPTVNEQNFYLASHGSDWIIQRHIIREQGVVLAGPDPKSMIDAVSSDDIRRAVTGILEEWWVPMLDNPSWLRDRGTTYHAYAILTMCRSLYALEHGDIVSKSVAAEWAQRELGKKWAGVIQQLLDEPNGEGNFSLYTDALQLIWYTMEKVKSRKKCG
jgi:predicted nucleotidyltransferase